ncbi:MAG: hypothetical protein V3T07_04130 [Myxococcota bacterium]
MPAAMHLGVRITVQITLGLLLLTPVLLAISIYSPARIVNRSRAVEPPDPAAGKLAAPKAARPLLGVAINAHHIGDLDLYLESVDQIAALGANALVVVTPMFQTQIDSNRIRYLARKCPNPRQLVAILRRGRDRGLHTTLLPIVLIEFPGEKEWRGVIRPADWDAWWASYDRFIDHFVDIAVAADVDLLAIGSELNSTEDQVDRWQRVIDRVRRRFTGRLTYAANWDRYDQVAIWPLLDVMSVSAYFELVPEEQEATVATLQAAWGLQRDRLLEFALRWERPLFLSEVGYPSLPLAAAHPWNYVASDTTTADHEAQARCYRAFFGAWRDALADADSGALGVCCYHWDPYHHGDSSDTGYGVQGKPAVKVIEHAFAEIRTAVESPDQPPATRGSAPDDR